MKAIPPKEIQKAYDAAVLARKNAYSPYSKFQVGAALLLEEGEIIPGCNVENASFGGTICAERNAFCAAIAKFGGKKLRPKAVVIVTEPEAVPCGLCLQVMAEFCPPKMPVYFCTPKKIGPKLQLRELLPHPFTPEKLK